MKNENLRVFLLLLPDSGKHVESLEDQVLTRRSTKVARRKNTRTRCVTQRIHPHDQFLKLINTKPKSIYIKMRSAMAVDVFANFLFLRCATRSGALCRLPKKRVFKIDFEKDSVSWRYYNAWLHK